jgi:hypothetical protein
LFCSKAEMLKESNFMYLFYYTHRDGFCEVKRVMQKSFVAITIEKCIHKKNPGFPGFFDINLFQLLGLCKQFIVIVFKLPLLGCAE